MIFNALLSQTFDGRMRHDGWGHPWLGVLFVLFIGCAIGLMFWALLRAGRFPHHVVAAGPPPPDPALETLRLRFARGEIGAEEFALRSAQLSGLVPPAPTPPSAPPV